MKYQKTIFRIFAIIGTLAVWAPTAFMLVTSIFSSIGAGRFLMDFLIPAELFLIELVGMLLLVFASWKEGHFFKPLTGFSLGAIVCMATIVIFAEASGLDNGVVDPPLWKLIFVYLFTGLMSASFVVTGIFGLKFTLLLFKAETKS